jgi:hypothetical protein
MECWSGGVLESFWNAVPSERLLRITPGSCVVSESSNSLFKNSFLNQRSDPPSAPPHSATPELLQLLNSVSVVLPIRRCGL